MSNRMEQNVGLTRSSSSSSSSLSSGYELVPEDGFHEVSSSASSDAEVQYCPVGSSAVETGDPANDSAEPLSSPAAEASLEPGVEYCPYFGRMGPASSSTAGEANNWAESFISHTADTEANSQPLIRWSSEQILADYLAEIAEGTASVPFSDWEIERAEMLALNGYGNWEGDEEDIVALNGYADQEETANSAGGEDLEQESHSRIFPCHQPTSMPTQGPSRIPPQEFLEPAEARDSANRPEDYNESVIASLKEGITITMVMDQAEIGQTQHQEAAVEASAAMAPVQQPQRRSTPVKDDSDEEEDSDEEDDADLEDDDADLEKDDADDSNAFGAFVESRLLETIFLVFAGTFFLYLFFAFLGSNSMSPQMEALKKIMDIVRINYVNEAKSYGGNVSPYAVCRHNAMSGRGFTRQLDLAICEAAFAQN